MAEATVKSLQEVRQEQIQESAAQQQRRLQTQQIAQTGKLRREASKIARRMDLPGYGRGFDIKVGVQKKEAERKIGEAFAAQAKKIEVATKKALTEGVGITGDVVVLPDGGYVGEEWFNGLPQERRDFLVGQGFEKYKQEYMIEIKPNENIDKEWFVSLPTTEQSNLKAKGLSKWQTDNTEKYLRDLPDVSGVKTVFDADYYYWLLSQQGLGFEQKIQQHYSEAELAAMESIKKASTFVALGTGEYVRPEDWENLTPTGQALLFKYGLNQNLLEDRLPFNDLVKILDSSVIFKEAAEAQVETKDSQEEQVSPELGENIPLVESEVNLIEPQQASSSQASLEWRRRVALPKTKASTTRSLGISSIGR
jgi:hypothetical protein